jgi:hypothetical protein
MTVPITLKRSRLLVISIICLASCDEVKSGQIESDLQQNVSAIDTSIIAVFPFDSSNYWVFKDCKPTDLTNEDLLKIDTILTTCIEEYNNDQKRIFSKTNSKYPDFERDKSNFIIDLTGYKRQYISVLNSRGEKEVFVNCFCRSGHHDWKKTLILVNDGGKCYFNLKINVTTGKYYDFMVNGEA